MAKRGFGYLIERLIDKMNKWPGVALAATLIAGLGVEFKMLEWANSARLDKLVAEVDRLRLYEVEARDLRDQVARLDCSAELDGQKHIDGPATILSVSPSQTTDRFVLTNNIPHKISGMVFPFSIRSGEWIGAPGEGGVHVEARCRPAGAMGAAQEAIGHSSASRDLDPLVVFSSVFVVVQLVLFMATFLAAIRARRPVKRDAAEQ